MNKTLRAFVVACCGILVGSLTAARIDGYFWWLGALLGGAVFYFVYEWNDVVAGAKTAWRYVEAWPSDREWHRYFWQNALYDTVSATTLSGVWAAILRLSQLDIWSNLLTWIAMLIVMGLFQAVMDMPPRENWAECLAENRARAIRYNLLTLLFYHPWRWLWQGVVWVAPRVMPALKTGMAFIVAWVKIIHSYRRLIGTLDVTAFSVIAYLTHASVISILLWAVGGGLFVVFHIKVIARRWLNVVPVNGTA